MGEKKNAVYISDRGSSHVMLNKIYFNINKYVKKNQSKYVNKNKQTYNSIQGKSTQF